MDKDVLQLLQSSYDRLSNPQFQNCFLHSALFPEDYVFYKDGLVESWIRDGLIENIESRQKQFDKGHTMIKRLQEACLLELVEGKYTLLKRTGVQQFGHLKMRNVVRDMALKVARDQNHQFMIRAAEQLQDLPCEKEWSEDLDKISLMDSELLSLEPTHPPMCPNLQTFLLQGNPQLWLISDSFFQHMKGLMYLDFSYCVQIKRLPESISDLENLRALVLLYCWELEYVPSLAKLGKLTELDLEGCQRLGIAPQGIEELVNLRYLNIKDSDLVLRWDHLCSKLYNLEDLRLHPTLNDIMVEDLMKLDKLERLEGWWICDIQDFNTYVQSLRHHQLKYYNILVGPRLKEKRVHCDRGVRIEGCGLDGELPVLCGLEELKDIDISFCDGIESIQSMSLRTLGSLERLYFYYLANLKALVTVGGVLPYNLRELRICGCDKIKKIFGLDQLLPNPALMEIEDCDALEEIFEGWPHPESDSCGDKNKTENRESPQFD